MASDRVPMKEGYDGRLYERQGRWRFFSVYGKRCRWCHEGILWLKKQETRRQIAIQPWSWHGEEWYIPKVHLAHLLVCKGMRDWVTGKDGRKGGKRKPPPDLIL